MPDPAVPTLENTARPAPALSATSDAPTLETPAEDASEDSLDNTQQPANDDQTGGDPQPGEDGKPAKQAKPDNTPPEVKREITKARNLQRAAEDRATRAETERAQALEALAKVAKPDTPKEDPRPTRDTFDDPDAYDTALVDWAGRQAAAKAVADAEAKRIQGDRQAQAKALTDSWTERKAAFVAEHPDYEDIAEASDEKGNDLVMVSIPMAHAIMIADNGPAISYWLGQNREEAAKIAKLDAVKATFEIGRIATRLATPAPKAPAKPDPMRPVGARANAGNKNPAQMSMSEYAAWKAEKRRAEYRQSHGLSN